MAQRRGKPELEGLKIKLKVHSGHYNGVEIVKSYRDFALVRWKNYTKSLDEDSTSEKEEPDFLLWMKTEELAVCCPSAHMKKSDCSLQQPVSDYECDDTSTLQNDVQIWVARLRNSMQTQSGSHSASCGSDAPIPASLPLPNIVDILSAYAKFGFPLINAFKSTGAVDLFLELLHSSPSQLAAELQDGIDLKKRVCMLLLSLCVVDANINSYILSKLMKENSEAMLVSNQESNEVLLDLSLPMLQCIASTAFTSIAYRNLPQLPASSCLCSVVKSFLKIDAKYYQQNKRLAISQHSDDHEYFNLLFNFCDEFIHVLESSCHLFSASTPNEYTGQRASIFNAIIMGANKKEKSPFEKEKLSVAAENQTDFRNGAQSFQDYLERVRAEMIKVPSSLVRGNLHSGLSHEGGAKEFTGKNVQQQNMKFEESSYNSSKKYLKKEDADFTRKTITKYQWWEVLGTLRKVPSQTDAVISLMNVKDLKELKTLTPTIVEVIPLILLLKPKIPLSNWEALTIVQELLSQIHCILEINEHSKQAMESSCNASKVAAVAPVADTWTEEMGTLTAKTAEEIRKIDEQIKRQSSYNNSKIVKSIKAIIKKYSNNVQIAIHTANCILLLAMKLERNNDYADCCENELFNVILSLMSLHKTSSALQTTCIKAFYFLIGPVKDGIVSCTLPTIISTIISLASDNPKINISLIVDGIRAIADYHISEACSPKQKAAISESISFGLMILLTVLDNGDVEELAKTYQQWDVAGMLCSISTSSTINFKSKKELCFYLKYLTKKTCYHEDSVFVECLLESLQCTQFLGQLPATTMEDIHSFRSVYRYPERLGPGMVDAKRAASSSGLFSSFIIKCLSPLGVQKLRDGSYKFVSIPKSIWTVFVDLGGLLHLSNVLTSTDTNDKTKQGCLLLLGCLAMDPEACPVIVIQNCLDAVLSILDLKPSLKKAGTMSMESVDLLDMCAQVLVRLSQSEEALALMCTRTPPLSTVLKGCSNDNRNLKKVQVLLARKEHEPEVLNRKQRNKEVFEKMFLVFADLVITHIDDARRKQEMPSLPFIRKIFPVTIKSKAKDSFRKVEVSSAVDKVSHLTDGDLSTYWEPRTSTNHWIDLQMKDGVIVKKLLVNFSEHYYDTAPTITFTGTDRCGNPSIIKKKELTRQCTTASIEDLKKHYSSIKITIDCNESYGRLRIRQISCDSTLELNPLQWIFSALLTQTQFHYSIQCHSWAYSGSSQNNLLDTFDKMMTSLQYEQKLADYLGLSYDCQFLLGVALKSSLIDYFFGIMSSEREQVASFLQSYLSSIDVSLTTSRLHSIMMSLLHRQNATEHSPSYISKNKRIQESKFKEIILLQSRVRRMCGFVADCFPVAQPNSAHSTLIAVWEDVVKFASLQFFKQLDFSSNPLSVMIEFLIFYLKIKQASKEIFKDSPLYIIAATEGLSRAILLLELTDTIKLCECMCIAIDQMLRGLTGLSWSELVVLLMEVADGLQCFDGLEATSIFELVYRKYLMRRTLNNCCQSLTLEMNVAELFLQCFPNMYPILMIENLKKSEEYLDKFKSSYISETFDEEIMLDCYQTSQETSSFEKMHLYKSVDFSATILSPNLWPIYPPLPMTALKFATPSLLVFVQDTALCKRLSWTQQGHSQIKCTYTATIINVSTTQMLILMAFKDMKRVGFQQLVDTLEMPSGVISSALQPLIKCAEPLLIVSHEESSNSTFYVYSINEKLLSSNCGHHELSYEPYHENSRGADDLQVISQRRRNVIRTQIVKFMKREKQSTIHNIYSTIREMCTTTELFGRFECTYNDIQAEVNDLVLSGYLKRLEANPHILLYTVDPYEGSCSDDTNWLNSPLKLLEMEETIEYKDTPLSRLPNEEATLLSVIRNIESSIQSVAELLSIDSEIAEVMLSTYSWNIDNLLNVQFICNKCFSDKKFVSQYMEGLGSKAINTNCPICFSDETVQLVSLHCEHVSCTDCWYRYLLISLTNPPSVGTSHHCSCMYDNCFMKPTRSFIAKIVEGMPDENASIIIAKYDELILQEFVKQCHWIGFCRNPKGCHKVVSTNSSGFSGTCQLCKWSSCSSCNFIEDHSPASCGEIREWIEAGGFHGGMSNEAKSSYLANQIAKRCPKCNMQIEKSAGCLHMTCKCGYHFCWKCLKSWADNHNDYYECKEEISNAVEKTRKFREQTQKCELIHASKEGAESMKQKIFKAIEGKNGLGVKLVSLLPHAQDLLVKCYQVQFYLCIVEYFSKSPDVLHILQDRLVSITTTLQNFLDKVVSSKLLNSKTALVVNKGYQLVSCVKAILKNVSFAAKEGFKLPCTFTNDQSGAPVHSTVNDEVETVAETSSRVERLAALIGYRLDDRDEEVAIHFGASDDYDGYDDDDFYYDDDYSNDVDYYGYGSSD